MKIKEALTSPLLGSPAMPRMPDKGEKPNANGSINEGRYSHRFTNII
jgi:hypothetical protein